MQLFTIGYQGRRFEELAAALLAHGVDTVLDVREIAWSRKRGFSKTQLQAALAGEGISYRHDPRLGSPRPLRDAYRASGDWPSFMAGFRLHLGQRTDVLREHANVLSNSVVCLLCFEGQAERCHRSAVADALAAVAGVRPRHL